MTRRILGVLLAIILAVLGTGAVLLYVYSAQNSVAKGQTAVKVLVAKQRIPAGTSGESIKGKKMVEEIVMPSATVPADSLTAIATELDKLVLTHDVQPRQLMLKGMFGAATRLSGGIAVPEKLLALSIKAAVEEEVGGFVRPGSQVAVFVTVVAGEGKGPITKLLLPRVETLAVGAYGQDGVTSSQQESDDGKVAGTVTLLVTVAVSQADAEKLVHAVRVGKIYLGLLTDTSDVRPGPGVDDLAIVR
ncbi:MAG TPA: RcpC/CpaB family pilus assembly protein [Candidatus Limnocylindrales bacterium]